MLIMQRKLKNNRERKESSIPEIYLQTGQFKQLTPKEKGSEESKLIQSFRESLNALPIPLLTYGTALNPELLDNPKPPFTPAVFKKMAGEGE